MSFQIPRISLFYTSHDRSSFIESLIVLTGKKFLSTISVYVIFTTGMAHESWTLTEDTDSWVRDHGLYYSNNDSQGISICAGSPGPSFLRATQRGPGDTCTQSGLQYRRSTKTTPQGSLKKGPKGATNLALPSHQADSDLQGRLGNVVFLPSRCVPCVELSHCWRRGSRLPLPHLSRHFPYQGHLLPQGNSEPLSKYTF